MQVVLHVSTYFDWEPVPKDVLVNPADVIAGRVKESKNGGYLYRVEKDANTHVVVNVAEHDLWALAVYEMTRRTKRLLTREQLVHEIVTQHLGEHSHADHLQEIETHDDGIDEAGYRAYLAEHVVAIDGKTGLPNIPASIVERMVAAYTTPSANGHADHLHRAYGVAAEKITASQARRANGADDIAKARDAHLANLAAIATAAGGSVADRAAAAKRFAEAIAASKAKSTPTTEKN